MLLLFFYICPPMINETQQFMQKNLVIVESPAKARTIQRFLGSDYKVLSSYGHIRDLKRRDFSIELEQGFAPVYEIPTEKRRLVEELRAAADEAEQVWLASDEDREGEAIAWHLMVVLGLDASATRRIVFHEITKPAIVHALANPRGVDINLVNAQQARRVLDRIVGFELSPVLWRKVKPALSAGRVQSVAVRLIVEREREVAAFVSVPRFRISAHLSDGHGGEVRALADSRPGTHQEAVALLESCRGETFTVTDVCRRPMRKSPAPPFTTSTLQQEAARKLGFTVAQTMILAQHLYENGLITYMRTDSVNLSDLALKASASLIAEQMGERYVCTRRYSTQSKGAQEAHEAIRPTDMNLRRPEGNSPENKLYELIWKRTLASQMADAELEKTTVALTAGGENFTAEGRVVVFDGFLKVYRESADEEPETPEQDGLLPPLKVGEKLDCQLLQAVERFTQAPPRYTEASLVRRMEELGIGRPSTYAPTISTIQQRGYVEKGARTGVERSYRVFTLTENGVDEEIRTEITGNEKSKLLPTDVGTVVNDFLMGYFPDIMDYNFTARVEKEFDEVAEGTKVWSDLIAEFYADFHPLVEQTLTAKMEHKVGERVLGDDPASGRPVFVKIGRFGPVVQIGSAEDEEKPRFAQLRKGQSIETITLEEALSLFSLPRTLGQYEDVDVSVGEGRFGPYVHFGSQYVSIPKGTDPLSVTLEDAIQLIEEKRLEAKQRLIKSFDADPDMQVLNGRYGPYIAYKGKNYKIPEEVVPADLNLEACFKVIELQQSKAETRVRKAPTKRKKK